jgi:hypothetical protein
MEQNSVRARAAIIHPFEYHQYNKLKRFQWQAEYVRDTKQSDIVIKTLQTDLWVTEVDASP